MRKKALAESGRQTGEGTGSRSTAESLPVTRQGSHAAYSQKKDQINLEGIASAAEKWNGRAVRFFSSMVKYAGYNEKLMTKRSSVQNVTEFTADQKKNGHNERQTSSGKPNRDSRFHAAI